MTDARVVLRQPILDDSIALPARPRPAAAPVVPASTLAWQAAHEEGLRQGREQGISDGYAEGLRQGRAAAQAEAAGAAAATKAQAAAWVQERRAEIGAAVAALQRAAEQWLVLAEDDMVALCFETIARTFGDVAVTPEGVRRQVLLLLEAWRGSGAPALRLHPRDVVLLEGLAAGSAIKCVADPDLVYGGCVVCGEAGALDARLDRILEEVKAALLAVRQGRAVEGRMA